MRRLFTAAESGRTRHALDWGVRTGAWQRVQRGIYADGPDPVSPLDRERARVLATGSVARGGLAGVLLGLDSVTLDGYPTRRTRPDPASTVVVDGSPCA